MHPEPAGQTNETYLVKKGAGAEDADFQPKHGACKQTNPRNHETKSVVPTEEGCKPRKPKDQNHGRQGLQTAEPQRA